MRQTIGTARTVHQVYTPEISIEGDVAEGLWAMQDRLTFADGSPLSGYGYYFERYAKREDSWCIAATKLTRLLVDFVPATPV